MNKNQKTFKLLVENEFEYAEKKINEFRQAVNDSSLLNTSYSIKWNYNDLVHYEFFYQQSKILIGAMETATWQENMERWLEEDKENQQRQINHLSINNSTGMMHNAYEFFLLQARVAWMKRLDGYLHELRRHTDES